jgi:hypothetical protein
MKLRKINDKWYPATDIDWAVLSMLDMTAPLEMPEISKIRAILQKGIRIDLTREINSGIMRITTLNCLGNAE